MPDVDGLAGLPPPNALSVPTMGGSDANMAGLPSPEIPASINLKPASDVDMVTRGFNEAYFANDPVASKNYLNMRGYEGATPDKPIGKSFWSAPLHEAAARTLDTVVSLPRLAAMGLGGLAGGALGIESGPGAIATSALGAGAADSAASAGLSALGSRFAGIEGSPASAAGHGAVEGAVSQVLGDTVINPLIEKAGKPALQWVSNKLADKVSTAEGFGLLKNLFGISNPVLGKEVADAAVSNEMGPNIPGVKTNIDKIFSDPEVLGLMRSAQAVPGNSLVRLGETTALAKKDAGELLGGITDANGNVVTPGLVSRIDAAPNSKIPWNQFEQATDKFVTEVTDQLAVSGSGKDYVSRAPSIRNALNAEIEQFKSNFKQKIGAGVQAAEQELALLKDGGKDNTGAVFDGLNQLKEKIAPYEDIISKGGKLTAKETAEYQVLQPQIASTEQEVAAATQKLLALKAKNENPDVSFSDLNDFKTAIGKLGNFTRLELKPDQSQGFSTLYGKLSDFVKAHAMAVSPNDLGPKFVDASDRYSLLSDFSSIIQDTVGAATKSTIATGLKPTGRQLAGRTLEGAGKALSLAGRPIQKILGTAPRALEQDVMGPARLNLQFNQAVRKIADIDRHNPLQEFRANTYSGLADEAGKLITSNSYMYSTPMVRSISNLVSTAGAQEPDLTPMKNSMTLSVLIDNGLAPPTARQGGFDVSQIDPETMMQVNQQVMQALAPLNDAVRFGGEDEIGAAYSQVAKQFPELFPAPKTGIKGEVTDSQGNVKLYDPMDRARYMGQIQVDSDMDWGEKAKVVSELNSTFTVKNPKKYK